MKRVLILASVASMIDQFNVPNIELLQNMGYHVDVACNFNEGNSCSEEKLEDLKKLLEKMNISYYQIDFSRKMSSLIQNRRAYHQVKQLLQKNQYEFLHCHSPIGGVVGRVAGKRTGTKVIYTAHGFHFYKGAPIINWLIYYPVERFLSRWTDVLITINHEDYQRAKDHFHMKNLEYIPGVGIDIEKFSTNYLSAEGERDELEVPRDAIWILSVGELIKRKNHETLIRAVAKLDNVYLTIAGQGELEDHLMSLIHELGVSNRVKLLGYRTDIADLCERANIFAFPSLQEGLPLALMEAMASGKPVICSRIRGNVDLIDEGKGGFLFEPKIINEIVDALEKIMGSDLAAMGKYNLQKIQAYDLHIVLEQGKSIYAEMSRGGV